MRRSSFPLAPIVAIIGVKATRAALVASRTGKPTDGGLAFCERIGVPPRRLAALLDPRCGELTFWEADTAACRIGLHPMLVWPDWGDTDDGFDEPSDAVPVTVDVTADDPRDLEPLQRQGSDADMSREWELHPAPEQVSDVRIRPHLNPTPMTSTEPTNDAGTDAPPPEDRPR
ncbi:MAG: hypothetical protein JST64_00855 [Actinobacteria bacterium]|nr:hypothetical protein [Actinomycetota bacterium]